MKLTDMGNNANYKKMNQILESRFGFVLDYNKLTVQKARRILAAVNEGLSQIRKSHAIHSAEKSPKYMELVLVNETLRRFIKDRVKLNEGEIGQAEVILAAKSLVDSIQDMIEKAGKMQNEELPPLMDSIRDQLGTEKASAYRGKIEEAVNSLTAQLNATREALDSGARILSGEEVADEFGTPEEQSGEETDPFAASDAAVGGTEPLGRELR
jgi:hypothetical protein